MTEQNHAYVFLQNLPDLLPDVPADSILSRSLYKDERINVTLFAFAAGQELTEHTSAQPAILHIIRGEADLTLGTDDRTAEPGSWVYMAPHLAHSIVARTPLVMLLTLIKDG
ncbi:MAG: cupin domain-containing protein [Candidatus Promineifilaceae bacterium]|nr:cupin domain-containing protein [Candidatus Promineifilaceae bacterium]